MKKEYRNGEGWTMIAETRGKNVYCTFCDEDGAEWDHTYTLAEFAAQLVKWTLVGIV